jgi:hypothetical protein
MAKKVRKVTTKSKFSSGKKVEWSFPLVKKNMYILLGGLGIIILGYLAMSTGLGDEYALIEGNWNSTTAIVIGPMLLVIAYCIIIPYGILKVFGNNEVINTDESAN